MDLIAEQNMTLSQENSTERVDNLEASNFTDNPPLKQSFVKAMNMDVKLWYIGVFATGMVLVIGIFCCFFKGRHSRSSLKMSSLRKSYVQNQDKVTGYVENTNGVGFFKNYNFDPGLIFPKPKDFKPESLSFEVWISMFESYAESFPKSKWKNLLLASVEVDVLKKLKASKLNEIDYKQVKQLLSSMDQFELMETKSLDVVAAINELCVLKRGKAEKIESYFQRFMEAARRADIQKEETLIKFFLQNLNNKRMVQYINQAITLQKSLTNLNSLAESVSLDTYVKLAKAYEQSEEWSCKRERKDSSSSNSSTKSVGSLPCEINMTTNTRNNFKNKHHYTQSYNRHHGSYQPNNQSRPKKSENKSYPEANNNPKQSEESTLKKEEMENSNVNCVNDRYKIRKRITGTALMNNVPINYLLDTGADETIMSRKGYKKLSNEQRVVLTDYKGKFPNSASGKLPILGTVTVNKCVIDPDIILENQQIKVADLKTDNECLLGMDIIQQIPSLNSRLEAVNNNVIQFSNELSKIGKTENDIEEVLVVDNLPNFETDEQLEKAITLEFKSISAESFDQLTPTDTIMHEIKLVDPNIKPIKQKTRPVPFNVRDKFKSIIDEQLEAGLIEPSSSPWSSPINIVAKTDGGIRVTQDYRLLNAVTIKDAYPLPVIEHLFNLLFTSFYSHPNSRMFTAFSCEFGLFQYIVMPMGLTNSPATFQRLMNKIFKSLIERNIVIVFLDDFLIHSKDRKSHYLNVLEACKILKEFCIKIKLGKCVPLAREIKFLGHVISANSIRPDQSKLEAIKNFNLPSTIQQLQSFLGLAGWYRRFIKSFAYIAKPLNGLLITKNLDKTFRSKSGKIKTKKVILNWNKEAIDSFNQLKQTLCSDNVLIMPDFNKEFILQTDACDYAIGAVLLQDINNILRPVAFFSKQLSRTQRKYSTSEKELLAIVLSVEHFHVYLYGRRFKIHSDHQPLKWLLTKKGAIACRLARWIFRLNVYDFEIIYKTGRSNVVADALSRMPNEELDVFEKSDEEEEVIVCVVSEQLTVDIEKLTHDPKIVQSNDENFKWLMEMVKEYGEEKPMTMEFSSRTQQFLFNNYEKFKLVNGHLYFLDKSTNLTSYRYCLPEEAVALVLRLSHDSIYSGHLGLKKTLKRVLSKFYRPNLKKLITIYVKQCDICQRVKNTQPKRLGELHYLKPCRPNQIVTMDIAGPFVESSCGNRYLLVLVCAFTKFALAIAMRSITAEEVARIAIHHWFCLFGIPEFVLSDRGKNFQSKLLELIYENLDIKQLRTTSYHPACDGQSERFIQTLKNMLKSHVSKSQLDWDSHLSKLCFAYNTSVHASIGFSPYQMMFGQLPRVPIDLIFPQVENELHLEAVEWQEQGIENLANVDDEWRNNLNKETLAFCDKQVQIFKNMYHLAAKNRNLVMDRSKIRHDKKIKKYEYNIGDLVLTDHVKLKKGLCSGLAHKYYGPFIVVGKHPNNVNYVIKRRDSKKAKKFLIHKNRLKLYFGHYEEYVGNLSKSDSSLNVTPTFSNNKTEKIKRKSNKIELNTYLKPKLSCVREYHVENSLYLSSEQPGGFDKQDGLSIENNNSENLEKSPGVIDNSYRPYYTKKTNRKYKKKIPNETDKINLRISTRNRKKPDRLQVGIP
ncbi:unnamed protein product [Brachionus calyciflorus]|uniref:RNA-directed DNA polymerase n=1 Tax=Brachionus calyciflorus TaxID=104777 RepID=A0A814EQ27_9BILA|nr:unnamed protein product [Brachionus calyciflorus]